MSLDKNLKLWLPLTKNAKNRGSKDVQTIDDGNLTFDRQNGSLEPFPSYAYFSDRPDKIDVSFKKLILTNFTISWWEKPEKTVENLDSWSLTLDNDDYITLYKTGTPKLSCVIEDNPYEINFLDDKGDPVTNVCDGYWHFYALTYKNNVFTLYKDIDFIGTAILEKITPNFKGLNIGIVKINKEAIKPFNGFICDFRMYDYYMENREIREKLAFNKKFDFMAIEGKSSKPIFYDNSGINVFKLESKRQPIIHGNSVVFDGDNGYIYAYKNDGLSMEKGFLSAWFIPYEPNNKLSIIFIDTSSGMALGICKDKSNNYKLLINCGEQQLETSFENINFYTINNVIIEYDKLPIRAIVNGIPQSIDSSDVSPLEKIGFFIGGTTKEESSFFGEILKISIYGANCQHEFLNYIYRPTLNMLKNSLASTLQKSLKFIEDERKYIIINLFSSELPKESVKFVFDFTTDMKITQKGMYLMHFASQEFGIRLYYNSGNCVGVEFKGKGVLIGQFTVNENKLSIEIKGEECICQLNNNSPVVLNVGGLLEGLNTKDEIIIGANDKYEGNYSGYLNVLKIYYDDVLSRKLIGAENYQQGHGLYDIETDRWYFF